MLDQLALATMIQTGRYDRHLRRMRALYTRRRDALAGALAGHAPAVRLSGLAAGFHAVGPPVTDRLHRRHIRRRRPALNTA
jgi:GntR family transcriptional regulator/MocR family aminotransferase